MNDAERKVVAQAISALVLADHLGDAHEATEALVVLLWGKEAKAELEDYFEDHESTALAKRLAQYHPEVWKEDR